MLYREGFTASSGASNLAMGAADKPRGLCHGRAWLVPANQSVGVRDWKTGKSGTGDYLTVTKTANRNRSFLLTTGNSSLPTAHCLPPTGRQAPLSGGVA